MELRIRRVNKAVIKLVFKEVDLMVFGWKISDKNQNQE